MSPGSKRSSKVRTLHIGESASEPPGAGSNREPKRGRVLVVDDERSIADSLAFMLAHEGYETKTAYSGTEAVKAAKEFRPNMLITDLVMPDISGTEAAIQISNILPEVKVIVFSGQVTGDELKVRAESAGCIMDIIEKPLHPQELLSKIRILMAR
jgi:DNA-binding response OmpR family regulator